MHYEHEASIREEDIATRTDVHAALAEGLAFPAHYGANLNALEDSLGDVSSPSIVRVLRSREEDDELPSSCVRRARIPPLRWRSPSPSPLEAGMRPTDQPRKPISKRHPERESAPEAGQNLKSRNPLGDSRTIT